MAGVDKRSSLSYQNIDCRLKCFFKYGSHWDDIHTTLKDALKDHSLGRGETLVPIIVRYFLLYIKVKKLVRSAG